MTTLPGLTWAVIDTKGDPVTSLAGLAGVMGAEAKDAAAALLAGPFAGCAPEALVAEARAVVEDTEGKAKGAPFTPKGDGAPPINNGSFVSWSGGSGRVDLIVTNGTVPGVDGDTEGTADSPAARVVVYEKNGDTWKASSRKVGAKVATLKRIPPLTGARFGKKSVQDELEDVRAEADALAEGRGLGEDIVPATKTLLDVYERGVKAWPGTGATELDARSWGLARARAFAAKALGDPVEGYTRDDDLLAGSPAGEDGGDAHQPDDPDVDAHEATDDVEGDVEGAADAPPADAPAEAKQTPMQAGMAAVLGRPVDDPTPTMTPADLAAVLSRFDVS